MTQTHDPHTSWLTTLTDEQLEREIVKAQTCFDSAMRMGKALDLARLQSNIGAAAQMLAFRKRTSASS